MRRYDAATLEATEDSTDVAITSANDVAWSPDGATIAVTNNEGSLLFLDATTLSPIGVPISTGTSSALRAAWHPDSTHVVTSNFQGEMTVIERESATVIDTVLIAGGVVANGLDWSPSGSTIAVTSSDGMVRYYDAATRAQLGPPVSTGSSYALDVIWNAAGTHLASVNQDGSLRVFTSTDHRPVGEPVVTGSGGAFAVAWNPSGDLLVTANEGGNIRFHELATDPVVATVYGSRAALSPDATRLVTTNFDDTIRAYDATSLEPIGDLAEGGGIDHSAIAWSPDGTTLALGDVTGGIALRDALDPSTLRSSVEGATQPVVWLDWSADHVLSAHASGLVSQLATGDLATAATVELGVRVTAASLDPTRSRLAVAGDDGQIRLLGAADLEPDEEPITTGAAAAAGVAWSSDGTRLATLNEDGTVQVVDVDGGEVEASYVLAETPTRVAWHPDDDLLAIGTSSGAVWLFTPDLEQLGVAVSSDSTVAGLMWAPDGSALVSTHANGSTTRTVAWNPQAACDLLRTILPTDEMGRLIDIPDASSRCSTGTVRAIVPLPATDRPVA